MYKFKIANLRDSFFCKETGLHLWFYSPVGEAAFVSKAIELAVKSGKVLALEAPKAEEKELELELNPEEGVDLEKLDKEELLSFIKENELEVKGASKLSAPKLRDAIEAALVKEEK